MTEGLIENNYPNLSECCDAVCLLFKLNTTIARCTCCTPQYHCVKEIHINPQHNAQDDRARYHNLALLELTDNIQFTQMVRPAILPQSWFYPITKLTSIESCANFEGLFSSAFRHAKLSNTRMCIETWKRKNHRKIPNGLLPVVQFCGYADADEKICRVSIFLTLYYFYIVCCKKK